MEMVFRISYFSTEDGRYCIKFAKTLECAKKFVRECAHGRDFKITPIKLK